MNKQERPGLRVYVDPKHHEIIKQIAARDCCTEASVLNRLVVRSLEREGYIEVTPDPRGKQA